MFSIYLAPAESKILQKTPSSQKKSVSHGTSPPPFKMTLWGINFTPPQETTHPSIPGYARQSEQPREAL